MPADLRRDIRGAALIEAALVLPVLLIVVFAIADFALFLWQLNAAAKAVQLGAKRAIVSAPVASGPGLSAAESAAYWTGRQLGASCGPQADGRSACPVFSVTCTVRQRCTCSDAGCGFSLVEANLVPILRAMRVALPQLRADQIEVSYATNYLGYVGRPIPVPVDVTVRLLDMRYDLLFLGGLGVRSFPITALVTMPGENMRPDGPE